MENKTLEMALLVAAAGFRVLPIKAGGKAPDTPHGVKDATTDPTVIEKWFTEKPNANLGIAMGQIEGSDKYLVGVDLDVGHCEGVNGVEILKAWQEENGHLPKTLKVKTGNSGIHEYYLCDKQYKSGANILKDYNGLEQSGVDIKAGDGYLVAPPSVNAETGKVYECIGDFNVALIADGGEVLDELLTYRSKHSAPRKKTPTFTEGSRNDDLYRYACSLQAKSVADEELRASVFEKNDTKCQPPLDVTEVEKIIESALKRPKGTKTENKEKLPRFDYEGFVDYIENLDHRTFFRLNEVSREVEMVGRDVNDFVDNVISIRLVAELKHYFVGVSKSEVEDFISLYAYEHRYNPVRELIDGSTWDGIDRLHQLYEMLGIINDTLSCILVKKWLMEGYCGLFNTKEEAFSLDLVLVFQGKQGFGKTRLLEKLALGYFGEGESLNPSNKDSIIEVSSCFIFELGELGSTMRRDKDIIKTFISKPRDRLRLPYGRKLTTMARRTVMAGTVNEQEYLVDDTGNRRWATVPLSGNVSIDMEQLQQFDAVQLWAQIKRIVEAEIAKGKTLATCWRLTEDEAAARDHRNLNYAKPIYGEQEVRDVLAHYEEARAAGKVRIIDEWHTATDFINANEELRGFNATAICKVFRKLGIESKVDNHTKATKWKLPWAATW